MSKDQIVINESNLISDQEHMMLCVDTLLQHKSK